MEENFRDAMVVLDTSIVIDYLEGKKTVVEIVDRYSESSKVTITFITEYELLKYKGDKIGRTIWDIVSSFQVLHSDDSAAVLAALIYKNLKGHGKLINENDILLAGICLANDEILLTGNLDFAKIDNKNIIVIK